MLDEDEQRRLLFSLKDGGGYGLLIIVKRRGDVLFAASPVPALAGYEIVCASPERKYDIWKEGRLITPGQDREQIKEWIQKNTPEWLYDDSETTETQLELVATWIDAFRSRYPGAMVVHEIGGDCASSKVE